MQPYLEKLEQLIFGRRDSNTKYRRVQNSRKEHKMAALDRSDVAPRYYQEIW
jgi:hypothetical protein